MKPKQNQAVNQKIDRGLLRTMAWLGLSLLLIISVISFWSGREFRRSASWRDHGTLVLTKMGDARSALAHAEFARRGYVITRDKQYLNNYTAARDEARKDLDQLLNLVVDNPSQANLITRIRDLSTMGYVDQGQGQPARRAKAEAALEEVSKNITDSFRAFETNEVQLLSQRGFKAERRLNIAGSLILVGSILAFLTLLYTTILLQRENRARGQLLAELRDAEARATEANELKSSFLANVSHEFRTPLNGIVGMTKLLEYTGLNSQQLEYLDTMKISSNSLLALINQILDFSKIESGKMQLEEAPFELRALLKSTVSVVEYSGYLKNLSISLRVAPELPEHYLGDSLRLRQVLLNLLNNAIKFSERGPIQLNVSKINESDEHVRLLFEVIDQGVGISTQAKAKLFQPFSQGDGSTSRKFGGSGLGLAISKQIIEMMNGHIGVDSQPGHGARFYFDVGLKTSSYRASQVDSSDRIQKERRLGAHVLIAEDNAVNQTVVTEMMKMLGCTVELVMNGHGVLESLGKQDFDLILMDGQMPEMDGYEASRRIRNGEAGKAARQIPILATTANAIKGDIEKCLECGMNDYIGKPISYDDLAYKVEKWLKRGRGLISSASIDRLKILEKSSGRSLLPELIGIFETESRNAFTSMDQAFDEKNFEQISKAAHTLKSSAANLGAHRLSDLSERLEKSYVDPHGQNVGVLIKAARREFAGALDELKEKWVR